MRTFIAVALPAPVCSQVQTIQDKLQSELLRLDIPTCFRWTPVKNLHITLRFLGETSPAQCAAIAQGLEQATSKSLPFSLHLRQLGGFPNLRMPNVLWLGIHGDLASLVALQTACEQLARDIGFAPEERPFSPHLTLARARRNAWRSLLAIAGQAVNELAHLPGSSLMAHRPEHTAFSVNELVHMQSELLPSGSIYTPLWRAALSRRGGDR